MKIKQFLIAVCIGTMFAACSSKDDYSNEAERIPIRINATIAGNLVGTRAVENSANLHGTSFVNGESFYIDICYSGTRTTIPSMDENGYVWGSVYNNGSLNIGENVFYPLDGRAIDVISVFPSNVDASSFIASDERFYVQKDQSTDEKYRLSDYMYAWAEGLVASEAINLTYHHLMSKVIIKLNGYEGTASDYSVTIKQVQTGTDLVNQCTKDVAVGETAEEYKDIADIKMGNYAADGVTAIVIPQTISTGKTLFEVTIGSQTYEYVTNSEITFQSGHVYTFNLSFNGDEITTGTIDIAGWTGKDDSGHIYPGTLQ